MAISKKAAKEIASLFNSISVGQMMIDKHKEEDFGLWCEHIVCAVNALRDTYGINVVGGEVWINHQRKFKPV